MSVTKFNVTGTLNIISQYNKHTPQRSAQADGQGLRSQTMFTIGPPKLN